MEKTYYIIAEKGNGYPFRVDKYIIYGTKKQINNQVNDLIDEDKQRFVRSIAITEKQFKKLQKCK